MSNTAIDIAQDPVARSRGFRRWWGCLRRSAAWTGAAVFLSVLFLSTSLIAQDTNSQSRSEDNTTVETPSMSAPQTALSAERLISILRQQPELLAAAKEAAANQLSVDPETITDDMVYDQIRQDPNLRTQITDELRRRGYDVSSDMEAGSPAVGRSAARNASSQQGAGTRSSDDAGTRSGDDTDTRPSEDDGYGWDEPRTLRQPSSSVDGRSTTTGQGQGQGQGPGQMQGQGAVRAGSRQKAESRPSEDDEDRNEPSMLHRHNPYPTLPSLQDLYSQFPSSEMKLKRFGSGVFRYGTGNADQLPMDLPAGPDYVLGPGDGLVLNLWGSVSQRLNRTVDRQGQLALPEAGTITVAGETIAQAQTMIGQVLGKQYRDIRVEISLARLRTERIYVVGDVQRPGAYDISSLSTPLNALYAAGGPTSRGSLRTVRHYRGKELIREVDLYDFLLHGVRSDVERLLPGDTILVPPVGPQVAVSGMVRRPAIYELKGEQALNQVLDLAGGVLVLAALRQINVERVDAHQRHTMLSVQLPEDGTGEEAVKTLEAFSMKDGDHVRVAPILPYNEKAVYLQGHVFRPGKYPYRDGITVNELLQSYQDLLPEPADHAEIIRLQAPDFRPMTISFALSDVLVGDDPIILQPFDVIRIFSRYEVDPPKVVIRGEVLRPGVYPLAQGMTVAGLVGMAGGFKRSAYREQADLSSYVVQDGEKVVTAHRVIEIGKAVAGDRSADVTLKPGDLVGIRQLTGWTDIGAALTVKGEVLYPGTYGITEGERLSSVLKRVGGFRETAYPAGAVFERVQVREMSEKARLEMIRRVETATASLNSAIAGAQEQAAAMQAMEQQRQQILASLRSHPASGRLVIRISADVSRWQNTPVDIEIRAGDVLIVPKRPDFVMVSGQVYNATAITYLQWKEANWYLRRAGGPTESANKKGIFILRADGSVVGHGGGAWKENVLSARLQPGDSIVVPEKISSGSMFWRNLMTGAQLAASVGLTAAVLR
jgi:protein involved in polysaccharide export with SLBB domain